MAQTPDKAPLSRRELFKGAALGAAAVGLVGWSPSETQAGEGRSRSLGASLAYGFEQAFQEEDRKKLALLHLFQGFVNVNVLRTMGHPKRPWSSLFEAIHHRRDSRGAAQNNCP